MMNCNDKNIKRYSLGDYYDFMNWLTDKRDELQWFIDDLDDDIDAFQKFYLTEYDLRPFNDLIEHTKPGRHKW